ncbi:MAG TPA: hypothetical protein VEL74_19470 [Thermoanaerobaculia bacterium]|nr:hypothetical protein [Thermoanaerobaculia bacterium]
MRHTFEGDDDLLRRYLLGELSEEETARLEPRLLEDDRLLEQMEAVEGDLLAEYAQGELTEEQEREVGRRLTATEEGRARLALARSLHRIANETPAEQKPRATVVPMPRVSSRRPSWYAPMAAMAAALLLGVVGLSVWPQLQGRFGEHPPAEVSNNNIGEAIIRTPAPDPVSPVEATPGEQPAEPAAETPVSTEIVTAPEPKPEPVGVELPLRSGQRSGEAQDVLRREVPGNAEKIEFRVPLRDEGFTSYKIVLYGPDRPEDVFPGLELRPLASGRGLRFQVPAAQVSDGLYRIEAFGVTASGDDELIGDQEFEIQR